MLFNKNKGCCDRQMGYGNQMMQPQMGSMECPIVEPTINKCIEREFCHEVPQV